MIGRDKIIADKVVLEYLKKRNYDTKFIETCVTANIHNNLTVIY